MGGPSRAREAPPGARQVRGALPGGLGGRARATGRRLCAGEGRCVDRLRLGGLRTFGRADSELAGQVRDLIERITAGIGVRCRIDIEEDDETLVATCSGSNLGLLIGKPGRRSTRSSTWSTRSSGARGRRPEGGRGRRGRVRERRRAALESLAVRSAEEALATHSPVELEPMTAVERKTVHLRLKEFQGVETGSEGTEPNRFVVISPVAQGPVRVSGPGEGASGEPGGSPRRLVRLERWLQEVIETPGLTAIRDRGRTRRGRCWPRMPCAE